MENLESMSTERLKFEYERRHREILAVRAEVEASAAELEERWDELSDFAAGWMSTRVQESRAKLERLEAELASVQRALEGRL